jgi:hypothetical protein
MIKHWTKAEALPILQEAFRNNSLAAQQGAHTCQYRGPYGPCIIGVLIDDETAAKWDVWTEFGDSFSIAPVFNDKRHHASAKMIEEVEAAFGGPDAQWFVALQEAHDGWATSNEYHREWDGGTYRQTITKLLELS